MVCNVKSFLFIHSKNFVYTRVEILSGKEVLGTSLAFALIIGKSSVDFYQKKKAEIKLLRTENPLSCRMVRKDTFQMLVHQGRRVFH